MLNKTEPNLVHKIDRRTSVFLINKFKEDPYSFTRTHSISYFHQFLKKMQNESHSGDDIMALGSRVYRMIEMQYGQDNDKPLFFATEEDFELKDDTPKINIFALMHEENPKIEEMVFEFAEKSWNPKLVYAAADNAYKYTRKKFGRIQDLDIGSTLESFKGGVTNCQRSSRKEFIMEKLSKIEKHDSEYHKSLTEMVELQHGKQEVFSVGALIIEFYYAHKEIYEMETWLNK